MGLSLRIGVGIGGSGIGLSFGVVSGVASAAVDSFENVAGGYSITLSGDAFPDGPQTFFVTDADIEGNLPVVLVAPTVTESPSDTYLLENDAILLTPSAIASTSVQWLRDGVDILGAVGDYYTRVAADVGTVTSVRVTYTNVTGATSTTIVATVSSFSVTKVNSYTPSAAISSTTYNTVEDLSAFKAGDEIVITSGAVSYLSGVTIDGVAMTQVHTDTGGLSGYRVSIYKLTLTADGAATSAVNYTWSPGVLTAAFDIRGVKSGALDDFNIDESTTTFSVSATPTSASNVIVGVATGRDDAFLTTGFVWDTLTRTGNDTSNNHGFSVAEASDVPVSAYTETGQGVTDPSDRYAVTLLAFSET